MQTLGPRLELVSGEDFGRIRALKRALLHRTNSHRMSSCAVVTGAKASGSTGVACTSSSDMSCQSFARLAAVTNRFVSM